MSPTERLVISTFLGNVRQKYSYQDTDTIGNGKADLKWGDVKEKFRQVLERCGDRLWNVFVESLQAHKLVDANERVVLSVDLDTLRTALPKSWNGSIPEGNKPSKPTPQDVFGYLFIAEYKQNIKSSNTRVELSTLKGNAYSTFGHVLDFSGDQRTYGEVFATDEARFQPRFTPRNWVVLNGVDFRSEDLDREEVHWTLEEVENSMICVARNSRDKLVASRILAVRHDPKKPAIKLYDDRNSEREPQQCDISMGLTPISARSPATRGRLHLGPEYFNYPLEPSLSNSAENYGSREVCGPTWLWRANRGVVARASIVLKHVPIHTVSEIEWQDVLGSADQKPSLADRCLVK